MANTPNYFEKLLGRTLKSHITGTVSVSRLLGNDVVGLYFSAHWCPPCRGFTPVLAEQYMRMRAEGKRFEVVFVSSDRDEKSFNDYYNEMPWLALPFKERDFKAKLSNKYDLKGLPTLVLLNGSTAEVISKDGRNLVTREPEAFPWQLTLADLLGGEFISHYGPVGREAIAGKYLGLYFGASWCPPCREFTPHLVFCYYKLKERGQNVEVIFVSRDENKQAFLQYYHKMPWLAFPFEKRYEIEKLNEYFKVEGIPTFVMLDAQGNTITSDARNEVQSDPEGNEFPWIPKPVNNLDSSDSFNSKLSLVVLAEGESAATKEKLQKDLFNVAEAYIQQVKAAGEDPEILFFIGTNAQGVASSIRRLTGLDPAIAGEKKEVRCEGDMCQIVKKNANTNAVLLDIPQGGGFYLLEGEVNEATLNEFLTAYRKGSLPREQLK